MNHHAAGHPVPALIGGPVPVPLASACVAAGFPSPAADHAEEGLNAYDRPWERATKSVAARRQ